jgi:hypothetical protein
VARPAEGAQGLRGRTLALRHQATDWPAKGPQDKARIVAYIDKKGAPMSQWFVPAWKEYETVAGNGA